MGRFLFWFPIAVFSVVGAIEIKKEYSTSVCQTFNKMEDVFVGGKEVNDNLHSFAYNLDLPTDLQSLKNVVIDLGQERKIHQNVSMQSHLVRYQHKLMNESRKVDSPSTYLSAMTLKTQLSIVETLLGKLNMSKAKEVQAIEDAVTSLNEELETNRNATDDLDEEISIAKHEMCVPEFDPYAMSDCWDLLVAGNNETGVYTIYPHGIEKQVLCDMDSNGGGWTVFLLRQKQKKRINFMHALWKEYKDGFGTPPLPYWMGNEIVHIMTSAKNYSVRLDTKSRYKRTKPKIVWAEWNIFKIASKQDSYRLYLEGYNKNSTMVNKHGFGYNHGGNFTTIDRPGRSSAGVRGSCAKMSGAFWHHGYGGHNSDTGPCSFFGPTHFEIYFYYWNDEEKASFAFSDELTFKIRPSKSTRVE